MYLSTCLCLYISICPSNYLLCHLAFVFMFFIVIIKCLQPPFLGEKALNKSSVLLLLWLSDDLHQVYTLRELRLHARDDVYALSTPDNGKAGYCSTLLMQSFNFFLVFVHSFVCFCGLHKCLSSKGYSFEVYQNEAIYYLFPVE